MKTPPPSTCWPSPRIAMMWSRHAAVRCCAWRHADCDGHPGPDQGEAGTRGTAEDRAREAAERRSCWAWAGARRSIFPTARLKTPRKSNQDCARVAAAAAARGDSAVLAGAASGSRHDGHAGLRSLFLCGLAKVRRRVTGAAPAVQDCLCEPLRGCAAEFHGGYHAVHRAAPCGADGLPLAVCQPGGGQRAVCSRGRDSRAHICRGAPLRPAGRACNMASRLCRRKWGWWTI